MPCEARNLENTSQLPSFEDLDVKTNDVKLNLELLKKYFQVRTLDQTVERHRNEFRTRSEHLQKRQEAFHERERLFKEKILSYEMYIKELAIKRDRSLRRIEEERNVRRTKQLEIDSLQQEINQMQEEKRRLENRILRYQPHANLLIQIVDRTDRFHSIDEMIEKFDMLHASYQDILMTMKNSNEELNDLQRQLLLTIERKTSKLSSMNNRIHDLEQNHLEIQHRLEKIQTEIISYRQLSKEDRTENGAMKIAIESMFDLVKRYSHRSRKKRLNQNNQCLFEKLKQIDIFLSDLVYYVDYVNSKQQNAEPSIPNEMSKEMIESIDEKNNWRGSCERTALIKAHQQPYFSYKIRGDDDILYTIQMMNNDRKKPSQTRLSLAPHQSSTSMMLRKKNSSITGSKFRGSVDTQPRHTRTTFKLPDEKLPFSEPDTPD